MKMKKSTQKRALVMSVLALVMCCAMLIGTTFAWFTDSVTSAKNIITAGNLDVSMEWFEGTKPVPEIDSEDWTDASAGAIFDYANWEPGYTQVRHIKIANEGTLALKYEFKIIADGHVGELAEVIDVYYMDPAAQVVARAELNESNKLGNLNQVLGNLTTARGTLEAGENHTVTLALKMQESAGNEYMNAEIAASFAVQLFATQLTYEEDSFDDQYDKDSQYPIVPVYPATTSEELIEKLANALPGDVVFVAAGEFEIPQTITVPSGVSLYGVQVGNPAAGWANDPNAEKTVIKYTGPRGGSVFEMIQTSAEPEEAIGNVEIDGILIDCDNTAAKGIHLKKTDGEAMENITVANCAVLNATNDAIDAQNCYAAVIEGNYINGAADNGICLGNYNGYHWQTWEEVTSYVRDNIIENITGTQSGAILLENGMGDVVVSGNVIRNVTSANTGWSSIVKAAAITVYDVYEGGEILIDSNTIENVDQGISVYKYSYSQVYGESWWEGPTADNDIVAVSNNKISFYGNFAIATEKLNEAGVTAGTTLVEITGNTITDEADADALVIGDQNSGWSVTAAGNTVNGSETGVNGSFAG